MIVGTAGHSEHGKTALVRALTGVDTDRLKEEKTRGLSVDLGFAYLAMPEGGVLGIVDVPGHERFVHTMLAGAAGIDFALLVVAADDGVMPQTIEHLAIVDLLGIGLGAVVITKADLVDAERLAGIRDEIADLLTATALQGAPIFLVSSLTGAGIADLRAHLFTAAAAWSGQPARGRFRLAVDRSFTLPEAGTVVTGTVLSGSVAVGDEVVVSPSGKAACVRAIHAQNRVAARGQAGDRCALNLAGDEISKDAISRGDVVLDPALHAPASRIDAKLRVLATETRPLTQWMPVRLHHATTDIGARIVLLGDEPPPGGEAFVQLVTDQPIAAAAGDRFVLRDTTAQRSIGGGVFVDLRAPARKRRTPERMAQLAAGAITDVGESLGALLDAAGYIDVTAFVRDRALSADEREALIRRLGLVRLATPKADYVIAPATWLHLKAGIDATLAAFHAGYPNLPGMALERLRLKVEPRLPAPVFALLLQGLARDGELALDGAWVRRPDHAVRLSPADEAAWRKLSHYIGGESRFRPPRVRDLASYTGITEPEVRRVLTLIGRTGKVAEIAHDHFFLREAVAEIVQIMGSLAAADPEGRFAAAQLRDRLGNGRKATVQILEFFDRHAITIRHGDLRRIDKRRLDLFGRSSDELLAPARVAGICANGRASFPVGRPDFKSGRGRETVLGGFDSHSLPPDSR